MYSSVSQNSYSNDVSNLLCVNSELESQKRYGPLCERFRSVLRRRAVAVSSLWCRLPRSNMLGASRTPVTRLPTLPIFCQQRKQEHKCTYLTIAIGRRKC